MAAIWHLCLLFVFGDWLSAATIMAVELSTPQSDRHPGPSGVHRADFVIDQAVTDRQCADARHGQVGRDTGGPLRPEQPYTATLAHSLDDGWQFAIQRGLIAHPDHDHIGCRRQFTR